MQGDKTQELILLRNIDKHIHLCYTMPRYEGVASVIPDVTSQHTDRKGLACFNLRDSCRR